MRLEGRESSKNIEDRRGKNVKRIGGGIGIGTILIVGIMLLLGGDPSDVLRQVAQPQVQQTTQSGEYKETALEKQLSQIVGVTLKENETIWGRIFPQQLNRQYQAPKLVIFDRVTQSACGTAQSATGPFYCPGDQKIYIDLSFYQELSQRFGASGDFALAYVVAHEVAHHIQNQLGITQQVHQKKSRISKAEYNDLSVRLELQADFLAGIWARNLKEYTNIIENGDIEEAINAAHAIGDDRIQKKTQGYVVPENFTHGTSAQRMRWFKKGFETGDISQGDTFNARVL